MIDRPALEAEWLHLTREALPAAARTRRHWPVRLDHCFQRILLDHAVGGRWYDHVAGRPAYRHLDPAALARAVAMGRAVLGGEADLAALNDASLRWRGKRKSLPIGCIRDNRDHSDATGVAWTGNSTRAHPR